MSLIDSNPAETLTPEQRATRKANRLKSVPKPQFEQLFATWKQSVDLIWSEPTHTALVLAALGTSAAELFDLSVKTAAFLESLKVGCTTEALSQVKPFTVHQDGTITLNPE